MVSIFKLANSRAVGNAEVGDFAQNLTGQADTLSLANVVRKVNFRLLRLESCAECKRLPPSPR